MYEKPQKVARALTAGLVLLALLSLLFRHTSFFERNQFINGWMVMTGLSILFFPNKNKLLRYAALAALLVIVPLAFSGFFHNESSLSDHPNQYYFVIGGLAFAALLVPNKWAPAVSQALALSIVVIATLAFLNFLYKVDESEGGMAFIYMSPGLAVSLILLSLVIMLEKPKKGFMAAINSELTGAQVLRVLIPVTVFTTVLLGALRSWLEDTRNLNSRFGTTLLILYMISLMVAAIWYTAYLINKREIQQKQIAQVLRTSQLELEAIFSNAPDAVVVVNKSGHIVRWNRAAEEIFGFPEYEVLGLPVGEAILTAGEQPVFSQAFQQLGDDLAHNRKELSLDLRGQRKNQSTLDISLRMAPYLLNDSVYLVGFIRDVTEKKATEARLSAFNEQLSLQVKEKTKELENVLERLTDGFAGLDTEFRFTYVNRRVLQILKMQAADLVGKKITDLFPWIQKYDAFQAVVNAFKSQLYTASIDYFKPLDFFHENHIYPDKNGVTIFIRDVTEKNKAQLELKMSIERYKTFIEEAVDPIFVYSPEKGKFTDANRKAAELLGYETEELLNLDPRIFDDDATEMHTRFEKLEAGVPLRTERKLKKKNGSLVEIEISAVKLRDGSILAFARDIGERKKSEHEMLRLNGELRRLGNYLQEVRESERVHIAREIHDELGQQMTVLKMDITWLRKSLHRSIDEAQRKKFDEMAEQVNTAIKTIRKIASQLRPSLLDDIGLSAAMEWHLGEFSKRTGILVKSQLSNTEQPLPDSVKTNIFRILQEALTNVARHSSASCVEVDFSVTDHLVELEIADNGKGFNSSGVNAKTLGLLGMRERAHMIGAEYDINSVPGKGTRVHLSYRL
ncbi:MAG: PAS domain S-box protein [Flavihumibacter sp.]